MKKIVICMIVLALALSSCSQTKSAPTVAATTPSAKQSALLNQPTQSVEAVHSTATAINAVTPTEPLPTSTKLKPTVQTASPTRRATKAPVRTVKSTPKPTSKPTPTQKPVPAPTKTVSLDGIKSTLHARVSSLSSKIKNLNNSIQQQLDDLASRGMGRSSMADELRADQEENDAALDGLHSISAQIDDATTAEELSDLKNQIAEIESRY
jgi:hypothetical protein